MVNNNLPFSPGDSVVAYLRDSSGEDQELSVAQQEFSLRAWCQENNLTLLKVFRDIARPGSSVIKRNAFLEMISHFHEPSCPDKGVVVWTFSRFARNQNDAQYYKSDLRRRRFIVYSLNDNVPDSSAGWVFEALIDWANEKFLETLSSDIKRGVVRKFFYDNPIKVYPNVPKILCLWVESLRGHLEIKISPVKVIFLINLPLLTLIDKKLDNC